jgi:hypothetical protein
MINLQSTREPVDDDVVDSLSIVAVHTLYVSQIRVDGVLWHRLRVGFFDSEAEAEAALTPLSAAFPRAWVGRAEPGEITLALGSAIDAADRRLPTLTTEQLESEAASSTPSLLTAEQVEAVMGEARAALLEGDNEAAVDLYARLAQAPGEHRPDAVEFLGLAYERSDEPGRARREYERYLREFADSPYRARVRQRLDSVVATLEAPRAALRDTRAAAEPAWDWAAGLSQYYRRDDNQFDEDQPIETTQSALLTDADFSMNRAGERFDILARVSFSHYTDLLDQSEGGRGDQNRLSYAYVDLAESGQQWDLRLGRQSLHTWGVWSAPGTCPPLSIRKRSRASMHDSLSVPRRDTSMTGEV